MLTLSYGYKQPETGDKGSIWFPALEFDINRLNLHSHNGLDSVKLSSSSVVATVQIVSAAGWVSQGGGTYKQTVTCPAGITVDDYEIATWDNVAGNKLYLTIAKVTANTFDVSINDNTVNLRVKYV